VLHPLVHEELGQLLKLCRYHPDGGGEVAVALVVLAVLEQHGLLIFVGVDLHWGIVSQDVHVQDVTTPKVLLNDKGSYTGVHALVV
jgi:hypothetical protein